MQQIKDRKPGRKKQKKLRERGDQSAGRRAQSAGQRAEKRFGVRVNWYGYGLICNWPVPWNLQSWCGSITN